MDAAAAAGWTPLALAAHFFDGGATVVQLRAKQLASGALLELAEALVSRGRPYGAQIIVPAGALAVPTTIGITRDSSNSPDFAVPDFDAVGATFELTPHGQAFSVPVTVRIPFDPAQVPNDSDPTLYKAEVAGAFGSLSTTVNGNFLEATVTSFSWVLPAAPA